MKFTDLVSSLPRCKRPHLVGTANGAVAQPEAPVSFIAPPLHVRGGGKINAQTPIILISAPGAVGKSTLASEIAASHASAIWDLSKLTLGANTFVGTLANTFGTNSLGSTLQALQNGDALLVFDAFDEAEILSGWDRVEGFVREIYSFVVASKYIAAIFLARTETAELLDVLLSELGGKSLRHALIEIDFFDRTGAKRFVQAQLTRIHGVDAHERHRDPFDRALGRIFEVVSHRLGFGADDPWTSLTCRSFLGYAPVLQAIAAYLADYNNYHEALARIESATTTNTHEDILPSLISGLLEREQHKFLNPLRDQGKNSGEPDPDWSQLYTEREQLRRIFSHVVGLDDAFVAREIVPAWLQQPYTEALRNFLPNHPFLRGGEFAGPAFQDYVYATLLTDPEAGPFVDAWLEQGVFVPTPLFADFYRIANNGRGVASHAGLLYDSVAASHGLEYASLNAFVNPEVDGAVHTLTIIGDAETAEGHAYEIELLVTDETPLTFRHRLRGAILNVRGMTVFSSPSQFEVADVELQTEKLELNTPLLSVRAFQGRKLTLFQADNQPKHPPHFRLEVKNDAELRVNWVNADRYPWAGTFDSDLFSERRDRQGAMLALRRILIWFRKDRREDLARFKELIDNVIIGHNELRQQMRDFLIEKDILREEGKFYMLSAIDAQRVGINWASLRESTPSAALVPLLDEFLRR